METCRVAIVFTTFIMTILVFAKCGFAESVAEDVAAIPPAPMESTGGAHLGVSATLAVAAFVATWFI